MKDAEGNRAPTIGLPTASAPPPPHQPTSGPVLFKNKSRSEQNSLSSPPRGAAGPAEAVETIIRHDDPRRPDRSLRTGRRHTSGQMPHWSARALAPGREADGPAGSRSCRDLPDLPALRRAAGGPKIRPRTEVLWGRLGRDAYLESGRPAASRDGKPARGAPSRRPPPERGGRLSLVGHPALSAAGWDVAVVVRSPGISSLGVHAPPAEEPPAEGRTTPLRALTGRRAKGTPRSSCQLSLTPFDSVNYG
jgi:hypothetical protein